MNVYAHNINEMPVGCFEYEIRLCKSTRYFGVCYGGFIKILGSLVFLVDGL